MFGWGGHRKCIITDFSSRSAFVRLYVSLFEQLCLATADKKQRMIVVTSPCRGEGRTTVAANLALCCARLGGQKALLVDADLERPDLAPLMKVDGSKGLWQALSTGAIWQDSVRPVQNGDLSLLPAGRGSASVLVAAQAERLACLAQQWVSGFDWVIVDTAPVLQSAGPLALGRHATGAILVIQAGRTREEAVSEAANRLREGGTRLLGVLLNRRSFSIPRYVYRRL